VIGQKLTPQPLRSPQIPYDWTQTSTVRSLNEESRSVWCISHAAHISVLCFAPVRPQTIIVGTAYFMWRWV